MPASFYSRLNPHLLPFTHEEILTLCRVFECTLPPSYPDGPALQDWLGTSIKKVRERLLGTESDSAADRLLLLRLECNVELLRHVVPPPAQTDNTTSRFLPPMFLNEADWLARNYAMPRYPASGLEVLRWLDATLRNLPVDSVSEDVLRRKLQDAATLLRERNTPPQASKADPSTPVGKESTTGPTNPLFERSGRVAGHNRLVSFLYLLIRDKLPAGTVEEVVRELNHPGEEARYSNGWLATYAEDIAKRIQTETAPEKGPRGLTNVSGGLLSAHGPTPRALRKTAQPQPRLPTRELHRGARSFVVPRGDQAPAEGHPGAAQGRALVRDPPGQPGLHGVRRGRSPPWSFVAALAKTGGGAFASCSLGSGP